MAIPTKNCKQCGENKAVTDFHKQGKYRRSRCKFCAKGENAGNYAKLTAEKKAQYARVATAKRYGLTLEEHDELFNGHEMCPICLTTDPGSKAWVVDHSHETGKVRGLLCSECNLGLGKFRDNIATLSRAQAYLEVNDGPNS
ncbi:MAG TPA: endonuclease VII domain-containing protein [Candidatus Paceibacterota bacterium]